MNIEVPTEDYDYKIHKLKILFAMVGVDIDYVTLDLMSDALAVSKDRGEAFNVEDAVNIQSNHEMRWKAYVASKKAEKA